MSDIGHFRKAIERMRDMAALGLPNPPTTQPVLQRQLAKLNASMGSVEPVAELKPFLREAAGQGADTLRRYELNRVLRGAWCDPEFDPLGIAALERADFDPRRGSDQAIIDGYLIYFPVERGVMPMLAHAASRAALRHEWAWRKRHDRWSLFDPKTGPVRIANDIATREPAAVTAVLGEAGIGTNLAASGFGQATFAETCNAVAVLSPQDAVGPQTSLLRMFDSKSLAGQLELIVRALLEPWVTAKPQAEHRKAISEFLLDQIGDPRLQRARWDRIIDALAKKIGRNRAEEIAHVFKRWLTDVAMRTFFEAIADTTDRPDQWRERREFWTAYLDADLILDAWPALGLRAKRELEDFIRRSGERPQYGLVRGGTSASSSIIFKIGGTVISEWSDNGSCRFWEEGEGGPEFYKKYYAPELLRMTSGPSNFRWERHVPSSPGWEKKFARIIFERTAVRHPVHGKGS